MMWFLFKKQKEIRISPKYYLLIKNRWAKRMNALTAGLSKRGQMYLLIVFVVLMGLLCVYHILKGFWITESNPLSVEKISTPTNKKE